MNPAKSGPDSSQSRPSRNAAATRDRILLAASDSFMQHSYDQVGLRSIAASAGIDAALISRYFGSKQELFAEVLASTKQDPDEILGEGRAGFGMRVADAIFDPARARPRLAFISLLGHSAASPEAARLLQAHIQENFVKPLVEWLDEEGATQKAWLIVSMLTGVSILARLRADLQEQEQQLAAVLQDIVDTPPRAQKRAAGSQKRAASSQNAPRAHKKKASQ